MLELKNIKKIYELGKPGDKNYQVVEALKDISIKFRDNEFVSILGPSGCGKTTLLNIIGGLDHYSNGDLIINGISTKEYQDRDWDNYRNHKIGFVFQSYNLIPHQTVIENVELALTLSGVSKSERRKKAQEALERVGLSDKLHVRPSQLSGGQMQRVAIARAIVNNPDIILADEPTGALDTKTSIQIMELLKEISSDKLIIMVTHNPELAESYSNRIVRLVDGLVVGDTNPCTTSSDVESEEKIGKTSMAFTTALSLSSKNLLTKMGRTALVSFAGSIGIIGISLILSLSSGFQAYIDNVQKDTLSTYPLTVTSGNIDYSSVIEMMMENSDDLVEVEDNGEVVPNNIMGNIVAQVLENSNSNDLKTFKKYIVEHDEIFGEYITKYSYNIQMTVFDNDDYTLLNPGTVFTDLIQNVVVEYNKEHDENIPPSMIAGQFSAINQSCFTEMLDSPELLKSQYDLVAENLGSHWPTNYDECVIVINDDYTMHDYNLYGLGLQKEPTLAEIAKGIVQNGSDYEITSSPIKYEDVLNKTYKVLLPTDYFELQPDGTYIDYRNEIEGDDTFNQARDKYLKSLIDSDAGIEIKIAGIIKPKPNATATSIQSALGYTPALTKEIISRNNASKIMQDQIASNEIDVITGNYFETEKTEAEIREIVKNDFNSKPWNEVLEEMGNSKSLLLMMLGLTEAELEDESIGKPALINYIDTAPNQIIQMMYSMLRPTTSNTFDGNLQKFGQIDYDSPSSISFYVASFEAKEELKQKIDDYNNFVENSEEYGKKYIISYTDYIGLMMSSVTTIIDAISYVLIAFVSVSLVVSSIMIGIITYISVLERTKEIGVLRSIGASKKDIKNVFTAESLIIGLISGLIGIGVTILLNIPINIIIDALAGIGSVAALPVAGAIILVILSCFLTFIAGLIPANVASKKDPVIALRTE